MNARSLLLGMLFCIASDVAFGISVDVANNTSQTPHQATCFLLKENFEMDNDLLAAQHNLNLEAALGKDIVTHLNDLEFTGKAGNFHCISAPVNNAIHYFMFAGTGADQNNEQGMEEMRRATGKIVNELKAKKIAVAVLHLPISSSFPAAELAKQTTIAALLTDYQYTEFKSDYKPVNHALTLVTADANDDIADAVWQGNVIGSMTNTIRTWSDGPANVVTPCFLAKQAKKLSKKYDCICTVFDREQAEELGLNGVVAVGKGSSSECRFIIVEYHAADPDAPTIALVGKGVVFDTGGVNLKSFENMLGMKYDMCGAAAVLGTVFTIAQLKPNVNVIAIAPAVENKTGSEAYRPQDIITFFNGKHGEILNTDAEGRNILADGLSYAEKIYKPDAIIDVATLTGACIIALGHHFSGIMSTNQGLKNQLFNAAQISGERLWELPMTDDYKKGIESDHADFKHIATGGFGAGASIAAHFLANFVENTPWAHLDIAGTAKDVDNVSYLNKKFGTGVGVRLLTELVLNYQK